VVFFAITSLLTAARSFRLRTIARPCCVFFTNKARVPGIYTEPAGQATITVEFHAGKIRSRVPGIVPPLLVFFTNKTRVPGI